MSRTGLSELRLRLRGMIEAGTVDYAVAGAYYWTDDQLDTVLDRYRTDVIYGELLAVPYQAAGSLLYQEYRARFGNFEQTTGGTAIFYVQDSAGENVSSALYTADYSRGVITFAANQQGSSFYVTGRSFDVDAAAADVWRTKASHAYTAVNFSTDNHSMSRAAIYEHCVQQAQMYEARSAGGVASVNIFRSDTDG